MSNFQMMTADQVRSAFPALVGPIVAGFRHSDAVVLVDQGRGAVSVMVRGQFRACCPTMRAAVRFADAEARS